MALYDTKPNAPSRGEMDILEIAARMVGLAIERDRLEEQLRQSSKIEAVGVLAGGIAHDFNNLLAAILGNSEIAMAELPADAPAQLNLKQIVKASVTAADLCNQLLTYAGRGATTTEVLDCNALVKEFGDLLQVALSKKMTLEFEIHEASLGIVADRSQLLQVIMNLITNASGAIGETEGHVIVSTSISTFSRDELKLRHPNTPLEAGEYVRIWISDTGVGMNPETQAKIFDPFFTTKPNGLGLGLAAVQGIVRSHGGAISVESALGEGTTFSILLPCVALPDEPEVPLVVPKLGTGPTKARVLVVDDERAVRKVLVYMLEDAGYDVLEACDGQEAVDLFRRESDTIDCVLLDLSMPKMDGEEAFAQLLEIRSNVRVILSSGFAEQELLNRFKGAGLAGVLQKPTQMHVLLEKLATALN